MTIYTFDAGSGAFLTDLSEAGIQYEHRKPPARYIASASLGVDLIGAIPWAALATVLVTWMRTRSSRKIMITTKDHLVIQAEGYSVEEVERFLPSTQSIMVIDTKNPEQTDEN